MAEAKYLDLRGLSYYDVKLKSLIPYPTYIKDFNLGTVSENGSIVSADRTEDIYKVTNKVYVGSNMNLLTYGGGDFELRQHFYIDGEYNGYVSYNGHGDEIIAVDPGVCIFEIISDQNTTINTLQLQYRVEIITNAEIDGAWE